MKSYEEKRQEVIEKLNAESDALLKNMKKLDVFTESEEFQALSIAEQMLTRQQVKAMFDYWAALAERRIYILRSELGCCGGEE